MVAPVATVTLFLCPKCGGRCDTEQAALEHCLCHKCGVRPVRAERSWRGDECARCFLKRRIREEQETVRRHKRDLASSEEHLAKMQAEYTALKEGV